jgi:hypothetical protein
VAFFAAKAILTTAGMTVSLTEPGVLRGHWPCDVHAESRHAHQRGK